MFEQEVGLGPDEAPHGAGEGHRVRIVRVEPAPDEQPGQQPPRDKGSQRLADPVALNGKAEQSEQNGKHYAPLSGSSRLLVGLSAAATGADVCSPRPVSYTHLTLPTIL